jgi:hypothetical protein
VSDGARELVVRCTVCGVEASTLVRAAGRTRIDLVHAPSCVYGHAVAAGHDAEEAYRETHDPPLSIREREKEDA